MQSCRETGSCASSWCRRQKVLGMGKRAIQGAFPNILVDGAEKPAILIATTGWCGTGVDSLQRANHAVLFELPFVEAEC